MSAHRQREAALAILSDLIAYPTVSADSNLALIADLEMRCAALGAEVRISHDASRQKANLFATLGPRDTNGGIVLSGHTDVVPAEGQDWTMPAFQAAVQDGKIYGRGACDMKGFLACALAMAPHFAAGTLTRPLHFAFTYDEEVGCLGAGVMLDALKASGVRPALAIIGEPTGMELVVGNKGCCEYTTHFSGLDGHGSEPDKGVNAVEYAVRFVARLLEIGETLKARAPADSRFTPPWTTLQVGRMAGGLARNIIAGQASVEWEMRTVNAADFAFTHETIRAYVEAELLPRMRAVHPDAAVLTETIGEVAGFEPMARSQAAALVQALTGQSQSGRCVAFGTEAGLFQSAGIDTVICGPGHIAQAHKPDEFVAIAQLDACLEMIENLDHHLR